MTFTPEGRKERMTPLTSTTATALKEWLHEWAGPPQRPAFPTAQGRALSRYAVTVIVARHTRTAAAHCPSLSTKRLSPHILRHTAVICRASDRARDVSPAA
jgi:integrase